MKHNIADWTGRRERDPRNKTLGTAATEEEKAKVYDALREEGFQNPSDGIRGVLFAFAAFPEVRDAVRRKLAA